MLHKTVLFSLIMVQHGMTRNAKGPLLVYDACFWSSNNLTQCNPPSTNLEVKPPILLIEKNSITHFQAIALFTITFSDLHYNAFERECEAISGRNSKIARNCLTSTIKYIVMQIRKGNCEKGYSYAFLSWILLKLCSRIILSIAIGFW